MKSERGPEQRHFDYSSFNEHLVGLSLTRAIKRKEWLHVFRITMGWVINYVLFSSMLLIYISCRDATARSQQPPYPAPPSARILSHISVHLLHFSSRALDVLHRRLSSTSSPSFSRYACVFGTVDHDSDSFALSWLMSLAQRFVAVEPLIILMGVMLPMLLATRFCSNMCPERCKHVLGVGFAVVITALKRLKRF